MANIRIETSIMKGFADRLEKQSRDLRSYEDSVRIISSNLGNIGSGQAQVAGALRRMGDNMQQESSSASRMAKALENIAQQYRNTEMTIAGLKNGNGGGSKNGGGSGSGGGGGKDSWWKKGWNAIKNFFSKDPVNLNTGDFIYDREDLKTEGAVPFVFRRFYNSIEDFDGILGLGWCTNYEISLRRETAGTVTGEVVTIMLEDGEEEAFLKEEYAYRQITGSTAILEPVEDGFIYRTLEGDIYRFDSRGRFLRFENSHHDGYDLQYEENRLVQVQKDTGEFYQFAYDENGYLSAVCDHSGRKCFYEVENGRLVKAVRAGGGEFRYEYDEKGRMVSVVNPRLKGVVRNEFDDRGRTTRQIFPDGSEMRFDYDDIQNAVVMTERNGAQSVHYHDERYRGVRNVYTDGEESIVYNSHNMREQVTDRMGNVTRYTYDNRGNLTGILTPDGSKIAITYESHNQPMTLSVNGKLRAKNTYNDAGDLLKTEDGLGRITGFSYDEKGRVTRIELPDGSTTTVLYDERGNAVSLRSSRGSVIRYEYDACNRTTAVTDSLGRRTEYAYDAEGEMIRVNRCDGAFTEFEHDLSGNITLIRGYDGTERRFGHTALNKLCEVTDEKGAKASLEYDAMWNVSRVIYPNGAAFAYLYNLENRLESIKDALGGTRSFTYDANGNILCEEDPDGAITYYEWDKMGRCIRVTNPVGEVTEYGYDADSHPVYFKDPDGVERFREYDVDGQLILERDSLGALRRYEYDVLGNLISEEDEDGNRICLEYVPGTDWVSKVCYPDGTQESYTFDEAGNVLTSVDTNGYTTRYEYDMLDRVVRKEGQNGETITFEYDAEGRVIRETDAEGNVTSYAYTLTGNLARLTDAAGNVTEYEYDAVDDLIAVVRRGKEGEEDQRTVYTRDALGHLTSVTDALGLTESYTYGPGGRIVSKTDRDGIVTKYSYNMLGRLSGVRYEDGRESFLEYSPMGRISAVQDWNGRTSFEYDGAGRLLRTVYPDNRSVTSTYDTHGNKTSMTYPDGRKIVYEYDHLQRLLRTSIGAQEILYSYDQAGRLSQRTLPGGTRVDYQYDEQGRVKEIHHNREGKTLDRIGYLYSRAGLLAGMEVERAGLDAANGSYRYTHDPLGRILQVSRGNAPLREYQYDSFGNRREMRDYTGNDGGDTVRYSYDAGNRLLSLEGRRHREDFRYDKRGNVIEVLRDKMLRNAYTYDVTNRIVKAKNAAGAEATYRYNGLGMRTGRNQEEYTLDYTALYNNLLEIRGGEKAGNYYWDEGLAMRTAASGRPEDASVYFTDMQGSILRRTGGAGGSDACFYDEFGGISGEEKPLGEGQFGFSGYQFDAIAGTYFSQMRQYRPYTGTFDARDRFGGIDVIPDSMNPYPYCAQMPLEHTDKTGYWFGIDDAIAAGIGAVGGVAGTFIGDVVDNVSSGRGLGSWQMSSWQEYTGSAIGGATGGVVTLYAGPIAGGAAGAGASRLATEGLTWASNPSGYNKTLWQVAKETAVDSAFGAASGALSQLADKAVKGIAGSKVVKNITSKWTQKGGLWKKAADKIIEKATGKKEIWGQITNLAKKQFSQQLSKEAKDALKKGLIKIIKKNIGTIIIQEIVRKKVIDKSIEKIIDAIKDKWFPNRPTLDKLKEWIKGKACQAVM